MIVAVLFGACSHAPPARAPVAAPVVAAPPQRVYLAVLPAESDRFPRVAQSATASMKLAQPDGVDASETLKVPLEVVQLAIECVDPSPSCYHAVGKSLAANELLFAQISNGERRGQVKIAITLFDVDHNQTRHAAEQVFGSERDATAAIASLVEKAIQP